MGPALIHPGSRGLAWPAARPAVVTQAPPGAVRITTSQANPSRRRVRLLGQQPEAIRKAAQVNNLPVDDITEVTVLDPYFYH